MALEWDYTRLPWIHWNRPLAPNYAKYDVGMFRALKRMHVHSTMYESMCVKINVKQRVKAHVVMQVQKPV